LIAREQHEALLRKRAAIAESVAKMWSTIVSADRLNEILNRKGLPPLTQSESLAKLLRRPEIELADLRGFSDMEILQEKQSPPVEQVAQQVEIEIKYEGFIKREQDAIAKFQRLEDKRLPLGVDYKALQTLSAEAREKLARLQPHSIGQAARISGVSPADVTALLVYMKKGLPGVSRETLDAE